jgi:hypothetical protein
MRDTQVVVMDPAPLTGEPVYRGLRFESRCQRS